MHDVRTGHDVEILHAQEEDAVRQCWNVFKELRPHLTETEFVRRWRRQNAEGYRLVYLKSEMVVVAAAGFRILNTMAWGKIIYLDDLVAGCGIASWPWVGKSAATMAAGDGPSKRVQRDSPGYGVSEIRRS